MENDRNEGIELLRVAATLMICIFHVLGVGGVMQNTEYLSGSWAAAWGLEKLMIGCANCYGLISGYVGVKAGVKPSRWINQWLQVVFYSAGFMIAFKLLSSFEVTPRLLLYGFFPVSSNLYWYFSCYTGLFVFMPMLNLALNTASRRSMGVTLGLAVAACGLSTIFGRQAMAIQSGYSVLWLMVLYLAGGWIRLHSRGSHPRRFWVMMYLLSSAAMLVCKLASDYTFLHYDFRILESLYSAFSSPLVFGNALALMMIFSSLRIRNECVKRVVGTISRTCFGVYLIHVHYCVWNGLLMQRWAWVSSLPVAEMLLMTVLAGVSLFAVCMAIDLVRIQLFRWMHIGQAAQKAGEWLERTGNRLLCRFK